MNEFKLAELEAHLKEQGYSCLIEESSDEFPFQRLLVELMPDPQERERIMEIRFRDQLLTPPIKRGSLTPAYYMLEYITKLPFEVKDHAILDTARLVAFFNRSIDFPGFEFDEVHGELYFRHTLFGNKMMTDIKLLHANLGATLLLIDMFSDNLEQCASGKTTMNEIIEASLDELEKIGDELANLDLG